MVTNQKTFSLGLLLAAMCFLAAPSAKADCERLDPSKLVTNPYVPLCSLSFMHDSYGRGLEGGFTQSNARPQNIWDETCYQLGEDKGRELAVANPRERCASDFEVGKEAGLKASQGERYGECFNAGYEAGIAALDVGARECDAASVGDACVAAYSQGRKDYSAGGAGQAPYSQPEATCYRLGYFEAPLY